MRRMQSGVGTARPKFASATRDQGDGPSPPPAIGPTGVSLRAFSGETGRATCNFSDRVFILAPDFNAAEFRVPISHHIVVRIVWGEASTVRQGEVTQLGAASGTTPNGLLRV